MTEPLKIEKTERGFAYAQFFDQYSAPCSIQESSLATEACIWLGREGDGDRMHLTQDQVRALLPLLQRFAETGRIGGEE